MKPTDFKAPTVQTEVYARTLGFVPNSPCDATVLQQMIAYCKQNKTDRLIIEPGTYHITIHETVQIVDMQNFEIMAKDVLFIFYSPITVQQSITYFNLVNCDTLKIVGLQIDWDWDKMPLASQVKVVNKQADYVDLEYIGDRPLPDNALFLSTNQLDPTVMAPGIENGAEYIGPNRFSAEVFLKREKIRDKVYRCYQDIAALPPHYFMPNTYHVVRHFAYNGGCFQITDSRNLIFEDVSVYAVPGFGVHIGGHSHHMCFNRFNITKPSYDPNRPITATVDGFHFGRGNGHILMENCSLGYQGDDCINIHDISAMYIQKVAPNAFRYMGARHGQEQVGDLLEFRNDDLSPSGFFATVTKTERHTDYTVYFLDKDIPSTVSENSVIYNRAYGTSPFEIRNCYFHETRARGILVLANDGIIEDCTFYHTQGAAIQIETGASPLWSEGMGVHNLIIRNNQFKMCDINDWDKGVLYMSTYLPKGIPIQNTKYPCPTSTVIDSGAVCRTAYPMFTDIRIENNLFEEYPRRAAILTSFDGVQFKNNIFVNNLPRIHDNAERGSVWAAYGKNLCWENNTFVPSPHMKMPVLENEL